MAIAMVDVLEALSPDEPDYARARKLGPAAVPFLQQIMMQSDQLMAAKAVYLAGLIGTDAGAQVVAHGASSANPAVRVAAAAAATELSQDRAAVILETLLGDADGGVRYRALKSTAKHLNPTLRVRITEMAEREPNRRTREEARTLLGLRP